MCENAHMQTVAVDFSRRIKGQDKAISSSVVIEAVLWQVAYEQRVAVVSRITNSCVEQSVIVVISVVSVKCEQYTKVVRTIKNLTVIEHIFVFTSFAINELIFKRF